MTNIRLVLEITYTNDSELSDIPYWKLQLDNSAEIWIFCH